MRLVSRLRKVGGIAAIGVAFALLVSVGTKTATARTWTDATGKHTIEAQFVAAKAGWVRLKKSDGSLISLPVEKLSKIDQAHVRRRARLLADSASTGDQQTDARSSETQTGRFTTTFTEHSPSTSPQNALTRMLSPRKANEVATKLRQGLQGKPMPAVCYKMAEETWDVYVPEDYEPGIPYGLFAFINSGDDSGLQGGWLPALKKHRLIFVGANNSGNEKDVIFKRVPMAVDAVHNLSKTYSIDPQRIYISGNSGGGRAASWAAMGYADVFAGGQFHVGANDYKTMHVPSPQHFNKARQTGRYVYITGDTDFNREQMQTIFQGAQRDGFRFVTYLQVPGMGHSVPPPEWFEKGLAALDAPLQTAAEETFEQAKQLVERGRQGDAMLAFAQAAAHGYGLPWAEDAKQQCLAIRAEYDEQVAELKELVAMGETAAANKFLTSFRKQWGNAARDDAKSLAEAIRGIRTEKSDSQ